MKSLFATEISLRQLEGGLVAYYRAGSSDERCLKEVVEGAFYRRKKMNFDVLPGERWLNLGANIGAFALYCRQRNAYAECYEPDPDCYHILVQNAPHFACHNTAVTNRKDRHLQFWRGAGAQDYYRNTICESKGLPRLGVLANCYGKFLCSKVYDGVKMDIEGSEFGLIDDWLLPQCKKLCMEYHLLRDSSTENLARRLRKLQQQFRTVQYPPEFDRLIAKGGKQRTFFESRYLVYSMKTAQPPVVFKRLTVAQLEELLNAFRLKHFIHQDGWLIKDKEGEKIHAKHDWLTAQYLQAREREGLVPKVEKTKPTYLPRPVATKLKHHSLFD